MAVTVKVKGPKYDLIDRVNNVRKYKTSTVKTSMIMHRSYNFDTLGGIDNARNN